MKIQHNVVNGLVYVSDNRNNVSDNRNNRNDQGRVQRVVLGILGKEGGFR